MKKKLMSILVIMSMMLTLLPTTVLAEENSYTQMKDCHTVHENCSYSEGVLGENCSHIVEEGYSCNTESISDYVCEHMDDCGYIEAKEAIACNHSCEFCEEKAECICLTKCEIYLEDEDNSFINQDCLVCNIQELNLEECKGEEVSLSNRNTIIEKRTIALDLLNDFSGGLLDKDGKVIYPINGIFDMLDTEGWKWDKNTNTLTLSGINVETIDRCAILLPMGSTVILVNENKVANIGSGNDATIALQCSGDVVFEGDGSLDVDSTDYVAIQSSGNITITGGNITANSNESNGIWAIGSFEVTGGSVIAESSGNSPGIWANLGIDMTGGEISGISAGSNGIGSGNNISISSEANVTATGNYPGLYSNGDIAISGQSVVNSTAANDTGLFAKGKIEISDTANVTATGNLYCGIQSNTDINIYGGMINANSPYDSAIYAPNNINISGEAEIVVNGKLRGLQSKNIIIEGKAKVEAISTEDSAITATENLSIIGETNVKAAGKICGILGGGEITLSSANIEANSITNYAIAQATAGKDLLIGGKVTAKSEEVSAIYSKGNITIEEKSQINATGGWCGIQVEGDINITKSVIEAIGNNDDGIFSMGTIAIDGGSIYAKGGSGNLAIRSRNAQISNEIAESKIKLNGVVGKGGAKVAFSDWNNLDGKLTNSTTFISKDETELIISDIGNIENGLAEVWLGEPFEVIFDVNGGSGGNSKEYVYPNDKVIAPKDEPTKDNTHFGGWYLNDAKFDIENTGIISDTTLLAKFDPHTFGEWITIKEATTNETGSKERTCIVCSYKQTEEIPKKSNSSGGGGNTTPSKPESPITGEVSIEGKVDSKGNTTVEITKDIVDNIIENAKKEAQKKGNKVGDIIAIINVKSDNANANTVSVNLPLTTQNAVIDSSIANLQLVIERPDIVLGMDLEAITKINEQAKQDVQINATKVEKQGLNQEVQKVVGDRPIFDITTITKDGKQINNLYNGKIKIELPYTLKQGETKDSIIGVYITEKGEINYLKDSYYDQSKKSLIIYTNHLSIYGVGTKEESGYQDIIGHWAKEYIDNIVKLNLIDGISDTIFAPDANITREAFVTALGRIEKIDEKAYQNTKFMDLGESNNQGYIAWAVEKGIVVGTSENAFSPTRAITREEIAVIIVNYKKAIGEELKQEKEQTNYNDHNLIEQWSRPSVEIVQKSGVMGGREGNIFDPKGNTSRAEASVILSHLL